MPHRPLLVAATLAVALVACRDPTKPRTPATADASASAAASAPRLDVAAWTRMSPAAFGCWMERTLGHRDDRFNCATRREVAEGDPCIDPDTYHDGPEFPPAGAPRLHPLLRRVDLSWEHGALQAATFTFAPEVRDADMARLLGLDRGGVADAASAGPGVCDAPCYELEVFEAADDDCEGDDDAADVR
ncbi:MAG: hypothetical protein ACJ79E_01405 [Anaeromyxobacteraceae bacterium]